MLSVNGVLDSWRLHPRQPRHPWENPSVETAAVIHSAPTPGPMRRPIENEQLRHIYTSTSSKGHDSRVTTAQYTLLQHYNLSFQYTFKKREGQSLTKAHQRRHSNQFTELAIPTGRALPHPQRQTGALTRTTTSIPPHYPRHSTTAPKRKPKGCQTAPARRTPIATPKAAIHMALTAKLVRWRKKKTPRDIRQ